MDVRDSQTMRAVGVLSWLLVASTVATSACSDDPLEPRDGFELKSALVVAPPTEEPIAEAPPAPPGDQDRRVRCRETTMAIGVTGQVEVSDFFIGAIFFADDTILRAKGHPECVAHIQTAAEAFAPAGTLTVSSETVGTPGGPSAPFAIYPDYRNEYYEFPDPPLFNFPDGSRVVVQLEGAPGFPAIPSTTLRSPAFPLLQVTSPTLPGSGVLTVASTGPFKIQWDAPTAQPGGARTARRPPQVSIRLSALSPVHWGELYCHWPASAGEGVVPAALLSEFRKQLGSTGPLDGNLDVFAGDYQELATVTSSYVLFVTTDFVTTFPRGTSILLE